MRRLIFAVCPDMATVGETRAAYCAAGNAASIANASVTVDAGKKHDRLYLRCAADGGIQLLRTVCHENIRIQCAGGGNQHAFGRQNAQQQSDRDTNTAQEKQLHGHQPVDLPALRTDGAECAVLLHPLGDGDLQNVIDDKSGCQQDKYADDDAAAAIKGKPESVSPPSSAS